MINHKTFLKKNGLKKKKSTEFSRLFFKNKKQNQDKFKVYGSSFSQHGFMVLSNNNLYGFGENSKGNLGVGDKITKNTMQIVKKFKFKKMKKICCGVDYSIFLLDEDNPKAYSSGGNVYGQLCLGGVFHFNDHVEPTQIIFRENIIIEDIFVGSYHTIFLTKSMKVYSGGHNSLGQLGNGVATHGYYPTLIKFTEKIINVSCSGFQTFFISINGNVYGVGDNRKGVLGITDDDRIYTPVLIPFFKGKTIIQIDCGVYHSVFLSSDNKVYAIGRNYSGELGKKTKGNYHSDFSCRFHLISSLENKNIKKIKCGGYHTLFIGEEKRFLCGFNLYGQLGNGDLKNVSSPFSFKIEEKRIIQSLMLSYSSIYFTTSNEIFGCGSNSNCELFNGRRDQKNPVMLKLARKKLKPLSDESRKEMKNRFKFLLNYFSNNNQKANMF